MKRLTKQSLDELASTMCVIPKSELDSIFGMYDNDCFWRCIAYLASNGTSFSESDAESYANSYFSSFYGYNTTSLLSFYGSGVTQSQISEYKNMMISEGSTSPNTSDIIIFNTNKINFYSNTNTLHAVVIKSVNQDGSLNVFDPQLGTSFNISAGEVNNVKYVF